MLFELSSDSLAQFNRIFNDATDRVEIQIADFKFQFPKLMTTLISPIILEWSEYSSAPFEIDLPSDNGAISSASLSECLKLLNQLLDVSPSVVVDRKQLPSFQYLFDALNCQPLFHELQSQLKGDDSSQFTFHPFRFNSFHQFAADDDDFLIECGSRTISLSVFQAARISDKVFDLL
jgi:hypothetical protein